MYWLCKKTISQTVEADTEKEAWLKFLRMEREGNILMDIEVYQEEVECENQ